MSDKRQAIAITGGAAGIGRGTLLHFHGLGWRVCALRRRVALSRRVAFRGSPAGAALRRAAPPELGGYLQVGALVGRGDRGQRAAEGSFKVLGAHQR